MFGGKAQELAPKLLLANCAAALEPRSDVIGRMHTFLTDMSPKQAEVFRALMTDERAGQHLMQLTLGDSAFLTQENASQVLEQIKTTLTEKLEERNRRERETLEANRDRALLERENAAENLRHRLMDAESAGLVAVSQTQELQNRLAATDILLRQERARGQEQRRQTVEALAQDIARSWRRAYVIIAVIAALVAGGVTWLAVSLPNTITAKVASVISALFITGLGFWRVPDLFIEPRLARWFACKFEADMHRLQVSGGTQ